ncbi:MAG: hypothetical protein IKJ04_06060 [Clostridia bacterium]|nr:hypothetical protein [Clostridia bacterium]
MSLCISLAWLCRKFDDRKNKILLLSFAGVLIASEIFKQIFFFFVVEENAICWGEFPFQMCSMPMYLCPVAVLSKNERISRDLRLYDVLQSARRIRGRFRALGSLPHAGAADDPRDRLALFARLPRVLHNLFAPRGKLEARLF